MLERYGIGGFELAGFYPMILTSGAASKRPVSVARI